MHAERKGEKHLEADGQRQIELQALARSEDLVVVMEADADTHSARAGPAPRQGQVGLADLPR